MTAERVLHVRFSRFFRRDPSPYGRYTCKTRTAGLKNAFRPGKKSQSNARIVQRVDATSVPSALPELCTKLVYDVVTLTILSQHTTDDRSGVRVVVRVSIYGRRPKTFGLCTFLRARARYRIVTELVPVCVMRARALVVLSYLCSVESFVRHSIVVGKSSRVFV